MGSTETSQVNKQEKESSDFFKNLPTDPLVFMTAMDFIVLFVAVTVVLDDTAQDAYPATSDWITSSLGWLFIGGVSASFIFLTGLLVSRYGRIRLDDNSEKPEYTIAEWFGIFFAGSTGSMLMLQSVAEPLNHTFNPPFGDEPVSREARSTAMALTIYHLGIHMWAIMALSGFALGYFICKRCLPPRVSSIFTLLLGTRIYSWPGELIDIVTIIGTVVDTTVSVDMGALQINSGAAHVADTPEGSMVQFILTAIIIVIALISMARGLDKGIKALSNADIWTAMALMAFVLLMGPTLTLLCQTVSTAGIYLDTLPCIMFWTDSYDVNPNWKQGAWTVFYWVWIIYWSPFVGTFVARISRGHTIYQFIAGVIALPVIVSIMWFSTFGHVGFELKNEQPGTLTEPVVEGGDPSPALFILLERSPLTTLVSVFTLLVVMISFVTSIDSASMVMGMVSTGEENKAPTFYRVLWGAMIGAVAASLLLISGETTLEALQSAMIVVSVPFFFLRFVMMYPLIEGTSGDHMAVRKPVTRQWSKTGAPERLEKHEAAPAPGYDKGGNKLPRLEYTHDEEGRLAIRSDVVVEGEFESGERSESEESGTKSES